MDREEGAYRERKVLDTGTCDLLHDKVEYPIPVAQMMVKRNRVSVLELGSSQRCLNVLQELAAP
jgi:hypothetical protein